MKIIKNFTKKVLHNILPKNRFGDYVYSFISFVVNHKRLPKKKKFFNDYLYKIKITNEILDPLRVFVSDKELVKLYVKSVIGEKFNVPTIKILKNFNEVKNFKFPYKCVIKPTHLSGHVIIKKNKSIDYNKINKWFLINHYERSREANYKTLKPKVIVEPILFNNVNLMDYKIFCYNGIPKLICVDIDRYVDDGKKHKRKYFDINWRELNFSISYPRYEGKINKPKNLKNMLNISAKLSSNFDFIRIDLYTNHNQIFLGEITNLSDGASGQFYSTREEKLCSELLFKY